MSHHGREPANKPALESLRGKQLHYCTVPSHEISTPPAKQRRIETKLTSGGDGAGPSAPGGP